jgi:hypothetical protein
MSIVPYREICGDMGGMSYKPFKPTGRWKYVTNEYWVDKIFVEHQGLIFKSWISEDSISFRNERSTETHECKKRGGGNEKEI